MYSIVMNVLVDWFEGNLCKFFFALITFAVVILGTLINIFESYLPTFISKLFRYGKFACDTSSKLAIEVPKSYFKHFYSISTFIYLPIVLYEVIKVYLFDQKPSEWFISLLNVTCGSNREANVSTLCTFISIILVGFQITRRFHDTHFVSIFSPKATINLSHYLIGMFYYPGVLLIILSEAPKFAQRNNFESNRSGVVWIVMDLIAILIFLWAWYHQHLVNVILANLRKNKKGEVVSHGYKLPTNDWFNYLSSPHQTAEIVMYTALTLILFQNSGWWYVYAWVISNQVETILLSHWWYKKTFKNFPKSRKALIPFVY